MAVNAHISGDFLDIYPYMNWIFLLTQEGDLLLSRTEDLISDKPLHDFLFRQSEETDKNFTPPKLSLEFGIKSFKKIAKIADMFSFADMRFFTQTSYMAPITVFIFPPLTQGHRKLA